MTSSAIALGTEPGGCAGQAAPIRAGARHRRRPGPAWAWPARLAWAVPALVARDWSLRRALVTLIAVAGVGVLLYPAGAQWFTARTHASTIADYLHTVQAMSPAAAQAELRAAHDYNAHLPAGAIRDPYSTTTTGPAQADPDYQKYLGTLNTTPDGVMGYLSVPAIGLNLPIYHGTGADTLDRGVGQLYGSALPVGGPGTDAVLTGHSGIVNSTLFTNINKLRLGDEFTVSVLSQTLTYRIDSILTVLPDQVDSLQAVPGEDHVTLVTCTPIGINSHRLLVRGTRVPTPQAASGTQAIAARATRVGFPAWALKALGALLAILLATNPIGRRVYVPTRRALAPRRAAAAQATASRALAARAAAAQALAPGEAGPR